MQRKTHSWFEAISNTLIGLAINLIMQRTVFPLFDIHITIGENLAIAAIFTIVSILRGYVMRRIFNRYT